MIYKDEETEKRIRAIMEQMKKDWEETEREILERSKRIMEKAVKAQAAQTRLEFMLLTNPYTWRILQRN